MIVAAIIARRKGYQAKEKPLMKDIAVYSIQAIPSLLLIVIIMGGILSGLYTPTEASAIAVVYCLALSLFYREIKIADLPSIILESSIITSIVLLLIGVSMGLSYTMVFSDIPYTISDALLSISDNPLMILLIINLVLLAVGMFMDMTPAILIFTPIFYPIAVTELGMDPVHFGIMITFNLCIGICTPPVGSCIFVGCSVGKITIDQVLKPLLPFFLAIFSVLIMVIYIPTISLGLPRLLGMM